MYKLILSAALVFAVAGAGAVRLCVDDAKCATDPLVQEVIAPYVQVDCGGSGVVIDIDGAKYVLTAGHVAVLLKSRVTRHYEDANGKQHTEIVSEWQTASVSKDRRSWLADVVWYSPIEEEGGTDLALLKLRDADGLTAARYPGNVSLRVGEDAWYIGSHSGIHASLEKTIINKVLHEDHCVMVNGNGWHGNSGGPLFVKRDGHYVLVGIVVRKAVLNDRTPILCENQDVINDFLSAWRKSK